MQMKLRTLSLACTILVLGSAVFARQGAQAPPAATERITREVTARTVDAAVFRRIR